MNWEPVERKDSRESWEFSLEHGTFEMSNEMSKWRYQEDRLDVQV